MTDDAIDITALLDKRVGELGERTLIDKLLAPRYRQGGNGRFGDDCAVVWPRSAGATTVVATVDPCPRPAAECLGFRDLHHHGWLAATISLSDLAAAGADPTGLLVSLILPSDLPVHQLLHLIEGIERCAAETQTPILGGNIREGPAIEVTVVGVGAVADAPLSRVGMTAGDVVLAVGPFGRFWAEFLTYRRFGGPPPEAVLFPRAQVSAGLCLRASGLVKVCMDASDGLWPTLAELAKCNRLAVTLDLDNIEWEPDVEQASRRLGIDPRRLALGWGDWTLVTACRPADVSPLRGWLEQAEVPSVVIGDAREGSSVWLRESGTEHLMTPFDSERLTASSWTTVGLEAYIDHLRQDPLILRTH